MTKHRLLLFIGPVIILLLMCGLALHLFRRLDANPILAAWSLASANYAAAIWCMTRAQKAEPSMSMLLVFGGSGIRIFVMIGAVFAVMFKRAEWMVPFCITLLICFVLYLIVEIWTIFIRGLHRCPSK